MADDAEASSAKIKEPSGNIGEKDLENAITIRKKQALDFVATETELTDIIDTLALDFVATETALTDIIAAHPSTTQKLLQG